MGSSSGTSQHVCTKLIFIVGQKKVELVCTNGFTADRHGKTGTPTTLLMRYKNISQCRIGQISNFVKKVNIIKLFKYFQLFKNHFCFKY